ncbi:hypothetical protein ACQCVK_12300 [Rossellomorea vietnamensis]|uniref:Uncharacterized protein n=1 Tax=Rossellomorea aquimaris TaxID=189382 RepID=A0A5D4THG8_9BACI|nr:hypothetical protein [Rossellomorea aquimaris]TYS73962.1 hypothetical protein FZC80_19095 [Rossellomorea aquimaris]
MIRTEPVNEAFKELMNELFFYPRTLPKTTNIQWHYFNNTNQNIINVNGHGGEIAKAFYPRARSGDSEIDHLISFTKFPEISKDEVTKWYEDAKPWADKQGINIADLFYWEQRMGNWGALFPLEQDAAIEEFSPFSNSPLLFALLKTPVQDRKGPDHQLFKEMIQQMWPETLEYDYNPILGINIKARLTKLVKHNPVLFNIYKKIKQ